MFSFIEGLKINLVEAIRYLLNLHFFDLSEIVILQDILHVVNCVEVADTGSQSFENGFGVVASLVQQLE